MPVRQELRALQAAISAESAGKTVRFASCSLILSPTILNLMRMGVMNAPAVALNLRWNDLNPW
jgi:hypothetical protein